MSLPWARATFKITVPDPITGRQCKATRDGFVRGAWAIDNRGHGSWHVTHRPTGRALPAVFKSEAAAKRCADEFDALGDWSAVTSHKALRASPLQSRGGAALQWLAERGLCELTRPTPLVSQEGTA